jgi:hypothetical protein
MIHPWGVVAQGGGGVASCSLRGGGRGGGTRLSGRRGTSDSLERGNLWVECGLLLALVASGRHDKGGGRDFFLFEKRG